MFFSLKYSTDKTDIILSAVDLLAYPGKEDRLIMCSFIASLLSFQSSLEMYNSLFNFMVRISFFILSLVWVSWIWYQLHD